MSGETKQVAKSRNAPVVVRTKVAGKWSRPLYFSQGDEKVVRIGEEFYVVAVHGAGWLDDHLVTSAGDLVQAIQRFGPNNLIDAIGARLRGSLCIYLQSRGAYHILPDPLGAAMLYEYRSQSNWAYSTDMESLISVIREFGEHPQKSIEYLTEVIATGNGGFFPASYNDVDTLPPFSYVSINDDDVKKGTYKISESFFEFPNNLDDLFEEARSDLIRNVTAVAKSNIGTRISHLTGGFDSRLILAALLNSGQHDSFRFMCSGSIQMPDRKIAGDLCGHLGLPLTNSDGTIKGVYTPGNAMFGTHGMVRSDLPVAGLRDHVLMSGGYGECLRSFYGARNNTDGGPEMTLHAIHGKTMSNEQPRLIEENFYQAYVERFRIFSSTATLSGIPADATLDYMYAAKRNRYYVGLISEYHSNLTPRVDPLYSVGGVRLGLFTPQLQRAGNVLGLRMMTSLWPELTSLPFDSDRITPIYESQYGPVARKEFNGHPARYIHDERIVVPPSKRASASQVERAKALRGSLLQVVHLADVQAELKPLLNQNKAAISKVMNWTVVNRFLNPNLNNRNHIRTAFALHDSLRWFTA